MLNEFLKRYPALWECKNDILDAEKALIELYENGGKLLICGNGGSCADSEHIAGELMKGFLKKRQLSPEERSGLEPEIADKLQNGLPCIPLTSFSALNTAFCNDVEPELVFAQPLWVLGEGNDMLIAISTSGNSKNVVAAAKVAKAKGMTVLALTGKSGGKLRDIADITVAVPEAETFKVQELHLPAYHYLCAKVEAHFYEV